MQIRKTISLTKRDEDFINAQVDAGEFNNTSEVFRAGLRLLEQEQLKLNALRRAIAEAEVADREIADAMADVLDRMARGMARA